MPDESKPEDLAVTFPARLDQRNCIFIPKNIRDFLKIPENAKLNITVKLSREPESILISKRQKDALKNVIGWYETGSKSTSIPADDLEIVNDIFKP